MADQNVEVTITVKRSDLEELLKRCGGQALESNRAAQPYWQDRNRSMMPAWYESYLNIKQALKWADADG